MFFQTLLWGSTAGLMIIFLRRLRVTLKDIAFQKQAQLQQEQEEKIAFQRLDTDEHFAEELKKTIEPKVKKAVKNDKTVRELLRSAETNLAKGFLEDAEKDFIRILAYEPQHPKAHHRLGLIYMQQNNMSKAEEMLRILVQSKKDAAYFNDLALCLFHQENFPEAAAYYEKAIEIDGKKAPRFVSLALVYNKMGETERALQAFAEASRLDPRNTEYLFMQARLFEDLNRPENAVGIYEKILHYEPYNTEANQVLERLSGQSQTGNERREQQ